MAPRPSLTLLTLALLLTACQLSAGSPDFDDPSDGRAPFSETVRHGDTVYLSGMLGTADNALVPGGIQAQTRAALGNIEAALAARDLTLSSLVKCTVFLANIDDFAAMNEVYRSVLPAPRPARTTVAAKLVFNAAIEIDCIAAASGQEAGQ